MGVEEMKEIGAVMKLVLSNTSATTIASGKQAGQRSKARYRIEPSISDQAHSRIQSLLDRHPLYRS